MKIVIILLMSVGFFSGCESLTKSLLKDPEVSVLNVGVTDFNFSEVTLAVLMNIKNPNPVPINLSKVDYELNVAGDMVTEGTLNEGIQVPATGENQLTLPLKFKFKSITNVLQGLLNASITKNYELKGSAQLGIFSIPFSKKGEVILKK